MTQREFVKGSAMAGLIIGAGGTAAALAVRSGADLRKVNIGGCTGQP
jgi:hypothetical protein